MLIVGQAWQLLKLWILDSLHFDICAAYIILFDVMNIIGLLVSVIVTLN